MNPDKDLPVEQVDAFADVATTHTIPEAERAELDALAAEQKADDPAAQAAAKAADDQKALDDAAAAQKAIDDAALAAAATKKAEEDAAAAAAKAEPVSALPQPRAVPAAPKDFDAAFADIQAKYDANELTPAEKDKALFDLASERGEYRGLVKAIEQQNADAHATLVQSFNDVATKWAADNAAFCANPLRQDAMQQAINRADPQGKLAPADLFKAAEKIAFEAFGWKTPETVTDPAADKAAKDAAEQATRDALKGRQPNLAGVPATLAGVPAAKTDTGESTYADLDAGDIRTMEAMVARMTSAEREKFLMEVDQ